MLTVFGTVALDTIRTPDKTLKDSLGGAATYAAISASYFTETGLVAVVGTDLPEDCHDILERHANLDGLSIASGKTFRYDGRYDSTLSTRTTLKTDLNVLEGFVPEIPEAFASSKFLYLANNDPDQNLKLLRGFEEGIKFSMCDTMDFWITTKRESVMELMGSVDAAVMNDEEARMLTGRENLVECAKEIQGECGVPYLIIKKGQHGSLLFYKSKVIAAPAYTLEKVLDPTGAGDSFAGAIMGYLAGLGKNVTFKDFGRAITYGNVMGSFAVQGYGLEGLSSIGKKGRTAIESRAKRYRQSLPV